MKQRLLCKRCMFLIMALVLLSLFVTGIANSLWRMASKPSYCCPLPEANAWKLLKRFCKAGRKWSAIVPREIPAVKRPAVSVSLSDKYQHITSINTLMIAAFPKSFIKTSRRTTLRDNAKNGNNCLIWRHGKQNAPYKTSNGLNNSPGWKCNGPK